MTRAVVAVAALLAALAVRSPDLTAQMALARPLPERDAFLTAVRENAARAQREQNRYAYKERRTDIHTNPFGRLGTGGTRLLEIIPDPDGLMATRRLLERDGQPVANATPERIRLARRREGGGSRGVDDVVQTLEFTISKREVVGGTSFIVLDFAPRPNAKPTTRQGRLAKVFRGQMWIDEQAQEITRAQGTAIEDISIGLGLVAKLRKGAVVTAERQPVAGGIWLPTSVRFNGQGRAMLFRKLDLEFALDWFDYTLAPASR